jgi:uncharacterized delta-60 repeat protein
MRNLELGNAFLGQMTTRRRHLLWLTAVLALSLLSAASASGAGEAAGSTRVEGTVEADGMVGYGTSQVLLYGNYSPTRPAAITRVNLDGSIDRSFGNDGTVHLYAESLAVDSLGRILIATSTGGESATHSDARVTRLLPDGHRDRSFGVAGNVDVHFGRRYDDAQAIALAPDGDILLAGTELIYGSRYGDAVDLVVARLKPDGELDRSFGSRGVAKLPSGGEEEVFDVAATPSGGVVVDGGAEREATIWKLDKNGSPDRRFGHRGFVELPFSSKARGGTDDRLYAPGLVVAPGGKLLLAAGGSIYRHGEKVEAVRLLPDGRVDRSYGTGGWATAAAVQGPSDAEALTLLPDGVLAIATTFRPHGTEVTESGAIAFDAAGHLDRGFASRGVCRDRSRGRREAGALARVGARLVVLGQQYRGQNWLLGCPLRPGAE